MFGLLWPLLYNVIWLSWPLSLVTSHYLTIPYDLVEAASTLCTYGGNWLNMGMDTLWKEDLHKSLI